MDMHAYIYTYIYIYLYIYVYIYIYTFIRPIYITHSFLTNSYWPVHCSFVDIIMLSTKDTVYILRYHVELTMIKIF